MNERRIAPRVHIAVRDVLPALGYGRSRGKQGRSPDPRVIAAIERMLARQSRFLDPRAIVAPGRLEGGEDGKAIRLGRETIRNEWLAGHMAGSEIVWAFVVTVGTGPATLARRMFERGEALLGLIADTIGSIAVEQCAQTIHDRIAKRAMAGGMRVTRRMSPGYGKWPLDDQAPLFRALRPGRIGVRLTPRHMMIPEKSISAVLGQGRTVESPRCASPCALCDLRECRFRRHPAQGTQP